MTIYHLCENFETINFLAKISNAMRGSKDLD